MAEREPVEVTVEIDGRETVAPAYDLNRS